MRQFVVSEAQASRIARHVREAVEDEGGIVSHHTAHKTEFDHLDYGDQAWRRAGYVGTYQRFKEKPVQIRIRVWAQWPRRFLVGSVYTGFTVAILFFLASLVGIAIPPNAWIFTAVPILAAIAISLLLYTSSTPDSEGAEEHIEAKLSERISEDDQIQGAIYDVAAWDHHREQLIDEAREQARERAPHGGSRVRKALASASSKLPSSSSGSAEDDDSGFLDRVKRDTDEADEPADGADDDSPSLVERLPGVGSTSDEEPETDDGTPPALDDEGDEGPSWRDRLPFGGEDDADEEAASHAPAEETDDPESSWIQALPFGSSDDEEDDRDASEDADDDAPSLGERLKASIPGLGGDEESTEPAQDAEEAGDDDGENAISQADEDAEETSQR